MVYVLIALGCNFIILYVIKRYMNLFFSEEERNNKFSLLGYTICYLATIIVYLFWQIPVLNGLTNVLSIFVITLFYTGKLRKKIFVSILISSTNAVADMIMSAIMFTHYKGFEFDNIGFIYSTLFIILCEIAIEKYTKLKDNASVVPNHCGILMIIPLCSIYLLYCVTNIILPKNFLLGICFSIMLINFVSFFIYDRLTESFLKQKRQENIEMKYQAYSNQIDIIREEERKMQAFQHDIKHHIIELLALSNQANQEGIQEYLQEMQKALNVSELYVKSGNKEVDCIINYYILKAKKTLEEIKVNINIPDTLNKFEYDFSVIMGNLLDNAIEAATQSSEKKLYLAVEYHKGNLFINIRNSFDGTIQQEEDRFITRKTERAIHGFGLENVKNTVNKYNGNTEIKYSQNMFAVDIILYCEI